MRTAAVTDAVDLSTFRAKVAARKAEAARRAAEAAGVSTPSNPDADLIPDASGGPRNEEDAELDRIINGISIIDAYNKWCGKMRPDPAPGQTEGIKISCPTPSHRDNDPSAWINTDKQTWYCGGCQLGGDAMDIAAYHFGYPVPGYKEGARFHELRRDMAKAYGYTFHKLMDGKTYAVPPSDEPVAPTKPAAPSAESESTTATSAQTSGVDEPSDVDSSSSDGDGGSVVELFEDDGMDDDIVFPSLEWRDVVPKNTFLDEYMKATVKDDVPEEYHFWNGLLALGLALGRDVRLYDLVPVYGNLFVCTLGHSGSGKSKARYHLDRLLQQALPYKADDPNNKGCKKISTPASAEVLVQSFQKPVTDPGNPKIVLYNAPVRGIVDFNELSSLVGRANRMGNVLKPTLMQFYDMESKIATVSLTSGNKEADNPFACALTTTQPRALKELLGRGDDSSGFLNRWLFAAGPEKQRYAIGGVSVDMSTCVKPLQEIVGWAGSFGADDMIVWSEEAAEEFTEFFHGTIEPEKKRSESELLTRLDLTCKKLCLLLTANLKLKEVPVEVVQAMKRCYSYIVDCYKIPQAEIGNSLQHEIRLAVAYQAQVHAKRFSYGISMSEIARGLKRRKYPLDLLKKTVELMVAFGELEMNITNTGKVGRPTERFRYVG
jgi:hypothetical protein